MPRWTTVLWGVLAGLVAAIPAIMILWGAWLLPALGLLWTRVNAVYGAWSIFLVGAVGGAVYGLVLGKTKLNPLWTTVVGLGAGAVAWFGVALVFIPLLLGFPPEIRDASRHWMSLVAFLAWGIVLALLYSRWAVRQSIGRVGWAAAITFVAVLTAPLLLRFAISTSPRSLAVPKGYRAEVVTKGLTYASSLALASDGTIYVGESGYAYGPKTARARVLAVSPKGQVSEVAAGFFEPLNGLALSGDDLYVSHRGVISVVNLRTGARRDVVTGLPSGGDHQNNDLVLGPDGMLHFGQGTVTNSGIVGPDNFVYAWADAHPEYHDIPSRDWTLTGGNYPSPDLRTRNWADNVFTGAFTAFATTHKAGDKVTGGTPASGTIIRLDPRTGKMETFADGFRNPYGLAFDKAGQLYATNLGYDDRGPRAVKNSPDWVVKVRRGAWYGWPDYAGTVPLADPRFASDRGRDRNPLISNHPAVEAPLATLAAHESPTKMAVATAAFGDEGGLYVGAFGDGQPLTGRDFKPTPTGVLRVDPVTGQATWFVRNKNRPRAGRFVQGFKRITAVRFNQTGDSLYVLDFGVMEFTTMAPNAIPHTGVLWKVSKVK